MARRHRPLGANCMYHLTQRGNNRGLIFRDDHDRRLFLSMLAGTVERRDWSCLAYCLMTNHLHLIVRTPEPDLADGMRDMLRGFAQGFNRRHARTDHVFGRRYGSVVIETDSQLLATLRYVALNPIEAGLVAHPARWPWSSYAALSGLVPSPWFLATDVVLGHLSSDRAAARQVARKFVEGPTVDTEVTPLDVDVFRRTPLAEVLGERASATTMRLAISLGHGQADIARHLGVSQATVSRRVRERADLCE